MRRTFESENREGTNRISGPPLRFDRTHCVDTQDTARCVGESRVGDSVSFGKRALVCSKNESSLNTADLAPTFCHAAIRSRVNRATQTVAMNADWCIASVLYFGGETLTSLRSNRSVLSIRSSFELSTKSRARSPEKVLGFGPTVLKPSFGSAWRRDNGETVASRQSWCWI